MNKMKVSLDFGTHHYIKNYGQVKEYCPSCGQQSVWVDCGVGDYYCGPTYLCTNCNYDFTIPTGKKAEGAYLGVVEQLKSGVFKQPHNPKGE